MIRNKRVIIYAIVILAVLFSVRKVSVVKKPKIDAQKKDVVVIRKKFRNGVPVSLIFLMADGQMAVEREYYDFIIGNISRETQYQRYLIAEEEPYTSTYTDEKGTTWYKKCRSVGVGYEGLGQITEEEACEHWTEKGNDFHNVWKVEGTRREYDPAGNIISECTYKKDKRVSCKEK